MVGGLLEGLKPEEVTLQRVPGAIPTELAKTGRRGAIAIDEAHVIAQWDRDERASLRAFMARDDRLTGIALASSDSHAERKLKRSSVLGYLGEEFTLPAIEIGDWRHGLRIRFDQAAVPIDDEALELLLEESRCHPYCTMIATIDSGSALRARMISWSSQRTSNSSWLEPGHSRCPRWQYSSTRRPVGFARPWINTYAAHWTASRWSSKWLAS